MNIQLTKAALKDCLGLPQPWHQGLCRYCLLWLLPSPCSQGHQSLCCSPGPHCNQGSQPMSMTLIHHGSEAECSPACSPAPNILIVDGISIIEDFWGRGRSPGTGSEGHQPSAWRTQAAAAGHWPKGMWGGGEGDTEWATSEWDTQF